MAELKTQRTGASVEDFLDSVPDERKRQDSFAIQELMRDVTGEEPAMWGPSIVGFGSYRYKYASGREGEWQYVLLDTAFGSSLQATLSGSQAGYTRSDLGNDPTKFMPHHNGGPHGYLDGIVKDVNIRSTDAGGFYLDLHFALIGKWFLYFSNFHLALPSSEFDQTFHLRPPTLGR